MTPARLAATVVLILTFLIIFGIFLFKVNDGDYAVLYSDLEIQDSAKIVQELDQRHIPYQAVSNGSVIKVNRADVVHIRLALAQEGLPNSGSVVGYEIFDKEDTIGTTNFSQNIKLVRALEGELSRTIAAFEQVEKARVHLVMPQKEIFSKERTEPRASVVLKFKGNKRLGKAEIDAISHLIVTSVPGLQMEGVTIVDTKGKALKIGSSEEGTDFAGGKNEDMKIAAEERLRQIIENLLESTLGAGKIKARVALEMNFDRIVTNSELYDPEGTVVRSVQSVDEKEQTPVGGAESGDASVANNIPGGNAGAQDGSGKFAIVEKSDQITNYEVSKTIKNHISEIGLIKKMSIGILVDGEYKQNPDTKEMQYNERSKEDLEKIANLVKVAVGFDEERNDKIEVINMKFSSELQSDDAESDSDWIKEYLPHLLQTLVFAVVVVLVLITVIRPIALKAFEVKKSDDSLGLDFASTGVINAGNGVGAPYLAGAALTSGVSHEGSVVAEGSGADGMNNTGSNSAEFKKASSDNIVQKINEMVDSNPQELVNILRKWLNEGS